ncbi:hypothetical protein [Microbacterium sp. NPDC058389]|uniref:hypothetical protein n=1 Tax=Microbacterium sp. NPDC058389 TaxID=3346475 RepID=UPI003652C737
MFWTRSGPAVFGLIVAGAVIGAALLALMSVFLSDRGEGGPAMVLMMALMGIVFGALYGLVPAALCAAFLLADLRGRRSQSLRIAMGTLGAALGAALPALLFFGRTLVMPGGWAYYAPFVGVSVVMAAIGMLVAAPLLAWGERRATRRVSIAAS